MLFLVHMEVNFPHDMPEEHRTDLVAREKALALELQRSGVWRHLWRVVGRYANYSVFDVSGNEELHRLLGQLPLFDYMDIEVTALTTHPSDLAAQS